MNGDLRVEYEALRELAQVVAATCESLRPNLLTTAASGVMQNLPSARLGGALQSQMGEISGHMSDLKSACVTWEQGVVTAIESYSTADARTADRLTVRAASYGQPAPV